MIIDTVVKLLEGAGLEVEVIYDGPASACPHCANKELPAAA